MKNFFLSFLFTLFFSNSIFSQTTEMWFGEAVENGQEITIPVMVENFNSIAAFTFFVEYDNNSLVFMNTINLNAQFSSNFFFNEPGEGRIGISWFLYNSEITIDNTVTKLFDLKFSKIVDGSNNFNLYFDLDNSEFSDIETTVEQIVINTNFEFEESYCLSENDVEFNPAMSGGTFEGDGINGNIFSPSEAGLGTHEIIYKFIHDGQIFSTTNEVEVVNNNSRFILDDVIVENINDEVFVSLRAENLTNIGAITMSFNYDTEVLEYVSLEDNQNFLEISDSEKRGFVNTDVNGKISVASFNIDGSALDIEDGALITFKFIYKGGITQMSFENNYEVVDITAQPIFCFGMEDGSIYPVAKITNENSEVCLNGENLILETNVPNGIFSGPGINENIFNPIEAGAGDFEIMYSYDYQEYDTTIVDTFTVTVFPVTEVEMNVEDIYCVGSSTLSATPEGGFFTGADVNGIQFQPEEAGNYSITYTYENENSCVSFITKNVEVVENLEIDFTELNEIYCQGEIVTLEATPANGYFSGENVVNNTFTANTIGEQEITYTYNLGSCNSISTQTVNISEIPEVNFTGLYEIYSSGQGSFELTPNIEGGTFSGNGISGNEFTPNEVGNFVITYSYTNANGCEGTYSEEVTVLPAPEINISDDEINFGEQSYNNLDDETLTYNISGNNLIGSLVISAPNGFTLSTEENGVYTSQITIDPIQGAVEETTIYVHFLPIAVVSYYATISHTSLNAESLNKFVIGTGINVNPIFTSEAVTEAPQNELYIYELQANDENNDLDLDFSSSTILPNWLNIMGNVLTGTPDNIVGTYDISLLVTDSEGGSSEQNFTIEITNTNAVPTAQNSSVTANEDEIYTFTLGDFNYSDIDGDPIVNITIVALETKGYLFLDNNENDIIDDNEDIVLAQEILTSDIPKLKFLALENENNFSYANFAFKVFDGELYSVSYSMKIDVNAVNDAPEFTFLNSTIQNMNPNEDFENEIKTDLHPENTPLDETNQDVTYSIEPNISDIVNLEINEFTGKIIFTSIENANGTQEFTITADDGQSENNTFSQTLTLVIEPVNDAPVFTSVPVESALEDDLYTYNLSATDIEDETLNFSVTENLPEFLSLNGNVLSGTPTNEYVGSNKIIVIVSDSEGANVEQEFNLYVANTNDAPVFVENEEFDIYENSFEGTTVGIVYAEDEDKGQSLTFSIDSATNVIGQRDIQVFKIDAFTGEISVLNSSELDYETQDKFELNVIVKDGDFTNPLEANATVVINVLDMTEHFDVNKIENCFTPDGDNVNDIWRIANYNQYKACDLKIFNSWRGIIFEGKANEEWDGTYEGDALPTDTYYYTIECSDDVHSGFITIFKDK